MRRLLGSILTAAVIATAAEAQTVIKVPRDYSTIQAAISAAPIGATIRVAPGIYVENINFLGKAIRVVSEAGADVTIIDGNQANSVVRFTSHENPASVLEGFTLRNGNGNINGIEGGGILIVEASPTIRLNRIVNNKACSGAGIDLANGSPLIQGNTISDNTTFGCSGTGGGGIRIRLSGTAQILDNVISNNFATNSGGGVHVGSDATPLIRGNIITGNQSSLGGGIKLELDGLGGSEATVIQNVIARNKAGRGGGIHLERLFFSSAQGPFITNNTIVDNDGSSQGSGIYSDGYDEAASFRNNLIIGKIGQAAVFCGNLRNTTPPTNFGNNDVVADQAAAYAGICSDMTGTNGNISLAPLLVNRAADNFRLLSGSPGVDAGDNSVPNLPALDMDSVPRILPSGGTVDMGAFEFVPPTTSTLSPLSLTFAEQAAGSASAPTDVSVTNTGTEILAVSIVAVTGEFSQTNTCQTLNGIAPGQSCTVSVQFQPTAGGPRSGQLTLTSNGVGSNVVTLSGNGVGSSLTLSSSFLNFGDRRVATTGPTMTLTVSNTGSQNLGIPSIATIGADFPNSNDCPSSLNPGSTCTISVQFTPSTRGTKSGAITLTSSASGSPHIVSLSGRGVAPTISFTPSTLQFGAVAVGVTTASQTVVVANQGELPLLIDSISITGDYSGNEDCPASLGVGETCTITVAFTPTAVFFRNGAVTVTDDTSGSPHTVALGGTGNGALLTPTPTSLVFGNQTIFTIGARNITVRNTGNITLTFSGIVASNEFTASLSGCPVPLVPSAQCTIFASFRPTSPGVRNGTLTITSSAVGSPNVVSVSGTGVLGGVTLFPASLSFSPDLIGTFSPPRVVALQNLGAGPLTISGIVTSGDYTQTNSCGTLLAVGEFCAISVVFAPSAEGSRSGSLIVTSDGTGSPHSVALNGTGLSALATPAITSMSPNSSPAGGSGGTITVNGSGFSSRSVILWNGNARPTTFVNQNTITAALSTSDFATRATVPVSISNPAPGGGLSNKVGFVIYLPMTLTTNDLISDRVRNRIYASVAATAPSLANTLTSIDPVLGSLENSVFVGPDPAKLAISNDSSSLYIALEGSDQVRPFDIASQMPGIAFSLGLNPLVGPYSAEDITVSPGNSGTIAVSRKAFMGTPRHTGVAIFDNGVMRPTTTPDHTGSNLIEFSASPSILYGYNNESTEYGFRTMSVGPTGAVITNNQQNLISGPVVDMQYEGGRIYASSGRVVDPVSRTLLGSFSIPPGQFPGTDASRGVVADSKLQRAFFLIANTSSVQILAFDLDAFVQTGSLTLPRQGLAETYGSLVRWGERGLAFRSETQVYTLEIPENWLPARTISRDFNGDSKSDVLWRSNAGDVSLWQLNGFMITSDSLIANIGTEWMIVGSGDFNGDGKADVLWRGPTGDVVVWLMDGATISSYGVAGNLPASWTVAGVGDFNGNGKADILWRETSGNVALWLMNGTSMTSSTVIANIWTGWTIAGVGDFNGDGRADALWRSVSGDVALWLMNGTTVSDSAVVANIWIGWTIAGTGDFDSDGRADILWRDPDGSVATWRMNGLTIVDGALVGNIWIGWAIARTGDFNGDGKADILWRDPTGNVAIWLMDGNTISSYAAMGNVSDRMAQ